MILIFRSVLALVIPVTVVGLIPRWITAGSKARESASALVSVFGYSLVVFGGFVILWCAWDFARKGQGTLAPADPPRKLVVQGLYRHVRNPMYVGALLALVGQLILFRSAVLAAYAAVWFGCVHLFVVFYEERTLRCRFGEEYDEYCQSVRRWVPRILAH